MPRSSITVEIYNNCGMHTNFLLDVSKLSVVATVFLWQNDRYTVIFRIPDFAFSNFDPMQPPSSPSSRRIGGLEDNKDKRNAKACNCKKSNCLKVLLSSVSFFQQLTHSFFFSSTVNVLPMACTVKLVNVIVSIVSTTCIILKLGVKLSKRH